MGYIVIYYFIAILLATLRIVVSYAFFFGLLSLAFSNDGCIPSHENPALQAFAF